MDQNGSVRQRHHVGEVGHGGSGLPAAIADRPAAAVVIHRQFRAGYYKVSMSSSQSESPKNLSPQSIALLKQSISVEERDVPHIFVVFGASVSMIYLRKLMKKDVWSVKHEFRCGNLSRTI